MNVLVIGGSGGIGLALVKQLLEQHNIHSVIATWCTKQPTLEHPKLSWQRLNLCDESAIAASLSQIEKLDWLINCAGVLHSEHLKPEKSLSQCQADSFMQSMQINALPSLLLAKHAAKALKGSQSGVFLTISAKLASISDNKIGGWHSYRCAKAALNMALKNVSIEWQRTHPKVCVVAWHPGTTDTALSKPFQKNVAPEKLLSSEHSAHLLLNKLQQLSPADTGTFWSWDGQQLSW
ncbi:SDR family NAD(P)-dependent oxidoreductase [Agarivorans aestuarii]|uniref:SDR family NAD(P)-dependent oxidoreductase n=1 Tax=Agarivorans aestuarii TaxID=1563703 RepID=A0ABU7G3Q8_9ALTE|nr:SDR family NAD(P)-dependent oxidoreductase [Agarivorans aestuarii]MEE1673841.1 SDR family NAD(P)-dependent oxidoreductase [Agarivorans aestuarii]